MGPYKVPYQKKYRFFLTLVDDHSRYTWLYLLQNKSEALSHLQNFLEYVKCHFSTNIKFISSDNALEFTSADCQQFFQSNGILHQTSCVNRPQQNARAERKHRHIHNIARSLRIQANLPLDFWGACVLTAAHLINKLPSPVLANQTPYYILHKTPPEYDHLKVFGCIAFAANPTFTSDKFENRGVPSIFLGYPTLKKGYLLLNLLTQKLFICRDVVFQETIFPFHSSSNPKFMQPIPPTVPNIQPCDHDFFGDNSDDVDVFHDSQVEESSVMSPVSSSSPAPSSCQSETLPPSLVPRRYPATCSTDLAS